MTMRYLALIKRVGFFPIIYNPPEFDSAHEAWGYLADQRAAQEDSAETPGDEYSATYHTLAALGTAEHWSHPSVSDWLRDNGLTPDGTGKVVGGVTAGFPDLEYSVIASERHTS